jgi:hypothetical protein
MSFAFAILFKSVLNTDGFIHEELAVHGFDGCIRGFEVRVSNETVTFGFTGARITSYL